MSRPPHDTTAAALKAAAQGWPVFPLAVGDKAPPRGLTDWEKRATCNPDQIRAWWKRAPYNIGIATGPAAWWSSTWTCPNQANTRPARGPCPASTTAPTSSR